MRAELEEVVAEGGGGDGADQAGPEGAVVEADGGVHVGGHQSEVVDALPAGREGVGGGQRGLGHGRVPSGVAVRSGRWRETP